MIYFVTGNKGKFQEAEALIGDLVQQNIGYTEIQADSLEEVAIFGISELSKRLEGPFIIEDAGLFIDVLSGFPGVYSAYVFDTIGNEGILRLMKNIGDRGAAFRSVVAYAEQGLEPQLFMGEVRGNITTEPRGTGGFGYDPIFEVDGRTIAEMELDEKNKISHRARALGSFKTWLETRDKTD
jgi:XTP/dITP diphosphohydrolase